MSQSTAIPRDPNFVDLSQFRGDVKRCPVCNVENKMSGRSCKLCLDHGFVAACLNCKTTGLQTMGSVWDGGRSEHRSPCSPCGGTGWFPVRRPANWTDGEFPVMADKTEVVDSTKAGV